MKRFALVTGASSGIGLAFARLLAADGYDLLITARSKKELEHTAKELQAEYPAAIQVIALDLAQPGAADKLWKAGKNRPVDILINNAGFGDLGPLAQADWPKLEAMIELNITTLTRLSQLAASSMTERGHGRILNVASIAGFFPGPNMAVYYATKAYVLSLTEALAEELSDSKVTVTALCPGPTRTHFAEEAQATDARIFAGKLPTPEQVAAYGYRALKQGKVVAVHRFNNKLLTHFLVRVTPRSVFRKIVGRLQS